MSARVNVYPCGILAVPSTWDTVFSWRQLAVYPQFQNKINIRKEFSVLDSKEKLQVSFMRKYNVNGSFSQTATGAPAPEGNASMQYDVEL